LSFRHAQGLELVCGCLCAPVMWFGPTGGQCSPSSPLLSASSSQRTPQNRVIFLEAFPVKARVGPGRDADAFWDHAPDRNLFSVPLGDRFFEIIRTQPSGADDDAAGRPGGDHFERYEHP
jgi:hypothetical protein